MRESAGRGIICLDQTIGGKSYETNTVTQFFQIKEPKGWRLTDEYYKATVDTSFTHMGGGGGGTNTYRKRAVVAMLNMYKQLHNLDVLGSQDATIMYRQEKYRALRDVNLIK